MKFRQAVAVAAGILAASALGTAWAGSDSKTATGMVDTRDYTLEVVSDHGNPVPAVGTHSYAWQSEVSCSVDSAAEEDGTGYACTGWIGTGSVPATGETHETETLTLEDVNSTIDWQWQPGVAEDHALTVQSGTGGDSYPFGTVVDIEADAIPEGHSFTGWTVSPAEHADRFADPNALATTFTMPAEAVTVTANYLLNEYTLTYEADENGTLTGETVQTVAHGAAGTPVEAVADEDYVFDQWSDGLTDNPRQDTAVADSFTVTAQFASSSHEVTFDLGPHGEHAAGGALTQTIDHGQAAQEPLLDVETDWRFIGWQPALPEQITEDWTGTAQYVRYNTWQLELGVAGADPDTVTLGMKEGATFDLDNGLDLDFPLPGPDEAGVYFYRLEPAEMSYQTDVVGCADTGEWFLVVQAGTDSPVELSWDAAQALPPERYLTMYALGEDHRPVGGSAINMADASERTVPAGETAFFILRYGTNLVADIALTSSWNLISLPLEPIDSAVETVFDEANIADGTPRRSALRDGMRGTIYTGDVWTYYDRAYHTVADLEACVGYWVFVENPAVLLIEGLPPTMDKLHLRAGWNLLGPPKSMAVPSMDALRGRTWLWDTDNQTYRASDELLPGRGHWMNAGEECSIDLSIRER